MKKKQIPNMPEEKLYELRKDIWLPSGFWRAGLKKTKEEWFKEFGKFNMEWSQEWFIDLSFEEIIQERDELKELIESVFKRKGLHSISYKEAAREVAELWLKQNKK